MPMNVKKPLSFAVLAGALAWSAAGMADEAMDLLAQMRSAVHTLNYSGTLVYAQGNELSTYQISHKLENGAERESVVRLAQGKDPVSEEVESFSLAKLQQVQPQMEQVYSLDMGGQEFVANRNCQIVVARPRDKMRYLQRYCIDPASGMLLKYSLIDRSHQSVEQLMFTSLDIAPTVGDPVQFRADARPSGNAPPAISSTDWVFGTLPAGFQLVQDLHQSSGSGQTPLRQLILSDGMTSVSVFVAPPGTPGVLESLEFSAGATNIYTTEVDKYSVALVGEVPVATLKTIGEGLRHVQ